MKKLFILLILTALIGPEIAAFGATQDRLSPVPPAPRKDDDIVQFNNLVILSVSGTEGAAEITATPEYGIRPLPLRESAGKTSPAEDIATRCTRFENIESKSGIIALCPTPEPIVSPPPEPVPLPIPEPIPVSPYRIQITRDTLLMLRDRGRATLTDFAAGNRINVFGYYSQDGTIRALIVRNLSKPEERKFIQLNNVEVIGTIKTLPPSYVVVHRPIYPCHRFEGARKLEYPCPLGIQSLETHAKARGIVAPEYLMPEIDSLRKYEVRLTERTIVLDRNRNRLNAQDITAPDKLNVYGFYAGDDSAVVEAEIVRDLSKPTLPPQPNSYSGTVTQVNADGSFIIQTSDGQTYTIQNPIQIGVVVKLRGILDELQRIISKVTEISVRINDDASRKATITEIQPPSGSVGTKVTLVGKGFSGVKGIYFGESYVLPLDKNESRVVFIVPNTIIPRSCVYSGLEGRICTIASRPLIPETYAVRVELENGEVSNTMRFTVTSQSIPSTEIKITGSQVLDGTVDKSFDAGFFVSGGAGNYDYSINPENLPPGLSLRYNSRSSYDPKPCPNCGAPLPNVSIGGIPTQAGSYKFTLTAKDSRGQVGSITFSINIISGGPLQILDIGPSSGPVGTSVIIRGSGFTHKTNTVNFAGVKLVGGKLFESTDGKTLTFTIPATPCGTGMICAQVVLSPGIYPLSVTNGNGTSNEINFTVTQ